MLRTFSVNLMIFLWWMKGLVEQLHLLKNINTRLTDQSDLREYGGSSADNIDETASLAKELDEVFPRLPDSYPTDLLEEDEVDDIVDIQLPRDPAVAVNIARLIPTCNISFFPLRGREPWYCYLRCCQRVKAYVSDKNVDWRKDVWIMLLSELYAVILGDALILSSP